MSIVTWAPLACLLAALPAFATASSGLGGVDEAPQTSKTGEAGAGAHSRRFRAPDGSLSALANDAAVLVFLSSAEIVEATPIGKGVSGALRVVLRRDGIEARAAFHAIDVREAMGRIGGRPVPFFVDSYRSQIAAYQLSRLMDLQRVPPTVERSYDGRRGSLHFWIEGGTDLEDVLAGERQDIEAPLQDRQLRDVWVFDALIRNTDRNQGNLVFDPDGRLWWIDHTRAFGHGKDLVGLDRVQRCSRRMWDALRDLDAESARQALGSTLSKFEIKALIKRRDLLVEHLAERIDRLGEGAVVFDEVAPP